MFGRTHLLQAAIVLSCLIVGGGIGAGTVVLVGTPVSAKVPTTSTGPTGLPAAGIGNSGPELPVGVVSGAAGTSGSAQAGSAIAYPYFGGAAGLAPDHTIVVTGTGQASLDANGSNRTAAQRTALAAAMADARSQADQVANLAGVTITGVLSVSVSLSPYGYVEPMLPAAGGAPTTPIPGSNGSTGAGGSGPAVIPPTQLLGVSVTVEYQIS